jgi:hypothetical protein
MQDYNAVNTALICLCGGRHLLPLLLHNYGVNSGPDAYLGVDK